MDEEKKEFTEDSEEKQDDVREEEASDEIRDEDYANDDEIEMDRELEKRLEKIEGKLDSMYDTISMFVDSGMVIREANPLDSAITEGDDFAQDFMSIDDLDFSID